MVTCFANDFLCIWNLVAGILFGMIVSLFGT